MSLIVQCILWVGLALACGLLISKLMKKIHFPNVTGYLIGGILIGPWVIGLINQGAFESVVNSMSWLSEIALGFIAFTIGGSFKLSALKKVGKRATIISIFEALGASLIVVLGLFVAYFCGLKNLGLTIPMILIFGSIACATAPAATLLVINQYRARGPVTETLIPVVAFDDAVALITFAIMFSIAKIIQTGNSFDVIEAIVLPILEIILSLGIGAILGFVIGIATKWFISRHNRLICIIACVLICVGLSQIDWCSLFGFTKYSFSLSSLLTVMALGGVYVNFAKGLDTTYEYLDKFTSPIFMLFFILSGAHLNFGIFGSNLSLLIVAVLYVITRVVGKWLGAAGGAQVTNCEPVVKKYLGFTLVPQAGVALGLAASAQRFLTNAGHSQTGSMVYAVIIVSTMIYELTGPLITKWALTKAGEIKTEKKAKTEPKAS